MRLFITVGLVLIAALLAVGCGSSKKKTSSTSTTSTTSSSTSATKAAKLAAKTYRAKLTGAVEVPKGAPKGSGQAVITIRPKKLQACWKFTKLSGFDKPPTASHIHKGAAGTSGPIVVPFGGTFKAKGCIVSTAATLSAIEKNPKGYYVNVHSKKHPNGAVRSQL